MPRASWDSFFMELSQLWATRATCSRRKVGAVVVRNKKVLGSGFNGVVSGALHCEDGGCPRGQLSREDCPPNSDYNLFPCKAIHAEGNAIYQAGTDNCEGATIYCTEEPCQQCLNLIQHVKIGRVVVLHSEGD